MRGLQAFAAAALLAGLALPSAGWAQFPARIRGTVRSLSGDTLLVDQAGGGTASIQLAPGLAIRADTRATLAAIHQGDTLGVVSQGMAPGGQVAVAIRVVPPGSLRLMGQFAWDLPDTTITNAIVQGETMGTAGRVLTLKAGDTVVRLPVAPDANIATVSAGSRALLVPGAHVVALATGSGSALTASAIEVGKDGVVPPL